MLHKNHLNSQNIFNQVGLIQVTCQGQIIADYEKSAMVVTSQRGQLQMNGKGFPDSQHPDPNFIPCNMRINGIN